MKKQYHRRTFLKKSALLAAAFVERVFLPFNELPSIDKKIDIVIAKGKNPAAQVQAALSLLGGIRRLVKRGDRVIILPNPQGRGPGTSTNADMVAETVKLCVQAEASSVSVSSIHGPGRWMPTGIIDKVKQAGGMMTYPDSSQAWITAKIPKGRILKKVKIIRDAIENDVLINMPIAKQHASSRITCNLKNLMGFNAYNSSFHQGQKYLHQCIVDLATIISPHLSIVDANTILISNGPFGPGKVAHPGKVFAGMDMVAIDALCCQLINLDPQAVRHIKGSHDIGLGEIDLSTYTIKEIKI